MSNGSRSPVVQILTVHRWRLLALFAVALLVAAAIFASERWTLPSAERSAEQSARSRAVASQGLVVSQLQKYRMLPLILSDYPDVQAALEHPTPASVAALDARLELIADRTEAAQIYVLTSGGITIAASNYRLATSFVGQRYGFRPYFIDAMRRGSAEQFALGTVSRRPGLFLARRVADGLGVIVVKVEFNPIETTWSHQAGATIVRDGNGVVIMTSRPGWRLRTTRALSTAEAKAVMLARLYGDRPPAPLYPTMNLGAGGRPVAEDQAHRRYMTSTLPIPIPGWTITALEPLDPAARAASAEFRIAILGTALVALVAVGLWLRMREARQIRAAAQLELERQVDLRTRELQRANELLVDQSRERERDERRLRMAREELAQSNRLATLGQITAGVAHEINQPLAALRAYADNTRVLLDLERPQAASANLDHIVRLSERIGDITGELRLFARREVGKGPVALNEAIEGSLLLIGDRLRQINVKIVRRFAHEPGLLAAVERVRLEQIIINLLQNASDALVGTKNPIITIETSREDRAVMISVIDNGHGIDEAARRNLFQSFVTQKESGLGLGLVISRDLAREVGGELEFRPGDAGTTFTLRIPTA